MRKPRKKVVTRKKNKVDISAEDMIISSAVAGGMPVVQANALVGYAPNTMMTETRRNLVDSMREKMQSVEGHTFKDDAERLVAFTTDKEATMPQVRATEAHIKMMGYDAPQRVEINERRDIHSAVMVIHALAGKMGVDPNKLLRKKEVL